MALKFSLHLRQGINALRRADRAAHDYVTLPPASLSMRRYVNVPHILTPYATTLPCRTTAAAYACYFLSSCRIELPPKPYALITPSPRLQRCCAACSLLLSLLISAYWLRLTPRRSHRHINTA